ncbi:2-C-methyl-D-erythritol 4-phosphate cytidylyltransferase [Mycobacterium sp. E740]|uniref:IspD/TarI family cytidylyltransferase n=1 Tax=Mycobacterium sp. E740 TaxID=1834149 RepID=UPI0007FF1FD3|nr:IspD/TarI family cytidylyltransferase [Mycobacterium sp. E740]OBI79853.1 2-C-methyl-D-erythritol 4-phosphate cytidylyltransferase [Mycobacterium sp. E740]OBI82220.1 2-C-methyl-D-erythritol 4-phosphate cytidylyltransferase [Mycobacterium sp. E740]
MTVGEPYAVAVVLAAGLGTRVGADGNKAYLPVAGRPMAVWSLETLTRVADVARIVMVYRHGELELARDMVGRELPTARVEFVEGGASRHGSELNALRHLAADIEAGAIDVVLIHDAARPVAGAEMFVRALAVAREFGGALPALPLPSVVTTELAEPAQAPLVRVQTPQAFRAAPLLEAYRTAESHRFEGTDTSSCVEEFTDLEVRTFPGELRNIKVTFARDIAIAEHLLAPVSDSR